MGFTTSVDFSTRRRLMLPPRFIGAGGLGIFANVGGIDFDIPCHFCKSSLLCMFISLVAPLVFSSAYIAGSGRTD